MIRKLIPLLLCITMVFIVPFPLYAESMDSQGTSYSEFNNCTLKDAKELEQFMDVTFKKKMEDYHIPGAVFSIVKDGKLFLSKGYGYAQLEEKIPVAAATTVFPICSITKLFTADAIMQLYETGKIKLSEDINKYLKNFKLKNPYIKPVTVEQLLTHTSGIDDHRIGDLTASKQPPLHLTQFLKYNMLPVVREPGSFIKYGSYETAMAGCLVEEVTGISYEKYITDNIFLPLDMNKSSLTPDIKGLCTPYKYENGKYTALKNPGYMNISPAGAIMSTADDMAKYMLAHLGSSSTNKKGRILEDSTIELMLKQHASFNPKLPGTAFGFYDKLKDNRRAVQHDGAGMGYLTKLCLFPESKVGIYIAVNQGDNWVADEIADEFINKYFPITTDTNTNKTTLPANLLKDYKARAHNYVGTYRFMEYTVSTFDKCSVFPYGEDIEISENSDGTLTLKGIGPAAISTKSSKIIEVEPQLFKKLGEDGYVSFRAEPNGSIKYMADSHSSYHGTYEKLSWYELPTFQLILFCSACFLFLIAIIISLAAFVRRKLLKIDRKTGTLSKHIGTLSAAISTINLAFIATMLYTFIPERLRYGVPLDSKLLLCIPIISTILTILMLVLLVNEFKTRQLGTLKRIYYTIINIAAIAFIWWVNFWNLIGFRY